MSHSNAALPIINSDFKAKPLNEKIEYLLNAHPIKYTLTVGELSNLLVLRELQLVDKSASEYESAEKFIADCYKKVQKVPLLKWQKLQAEPVVNF